MITKANFVSMSVEELWGIYGEISKLLEVKMLADRGCSSSGLLVCALPRPVAKRPVVPIHRSFLSSQIRMSRSQVWAGRGRQPRWVTEKLSSGLALGDLSIGRGSSVAMPEEHLVGEIAEELR